MSYENVAVIIPCYNEALTIDKVVDDYARELPGTTVYVYDNNSRGETSAVAREHGAVVRPEPRQGKGNVCRQMFPTSRPAATSLSTATTPTTRPSVFSNIFLNKSLCSN